MQIIHALEQSSNFFSKRYQQGQLHGHFLPSHFCRGRSSMDCHSRGSWNLYEYPQAPVQDILCFPSPKHCIPWLHTVDGQLMPRCVLTGYIQLLCISCYFSPDLSFTFTWLSGSDTGCRFQLVQLLARCLHDLHVGTSGSWPLAWLISPGTPKFWLMISKYLPLIRFTAQAKSINKNKAVKHRSHNPAGGSGA